MFVVLYVIIFLTITLFIAAGLRIRQFWKSDHTPSGEVLVQPFSPSRYKPMEKLLSRKELDFIQSHPCFSTDSLKRIRAERRSIFRKYIKMMCADFHQLTNAIRHIMVQSTETRPELAKALVRAQLLFTLTIVLLEARLILQATGFDMLTVSSARLIHVLEQMQGEWQSLSVASSVAA